MLECVHSKPLGVPHLVRFDRKECLAVASHETSHLLLTIAALNLTPAVVAYSIGQA